MISCILAFQTERSNYNPVWLTITYLCVVIFWAVRYQIGFDYEGYMDIFLSVKYDRFTFVELGYYYLNKLFSFSPHGYIYVIGLTTAMIYLFLFKMMVQRHILLYGLFFALGFQFQFLAANQMRQALVIAGFLYAIRYIELKQYWKYIIWMAVLMLFHFTAIFLLIVIPLSKIKLPKWACLTALFGAFILLQLGVFKTLGTIILQSMPFYEQYQNMAFRMQAEDTGFSIVMLFYLLVACYLILYRNTIDHPALFNVYIIGLTAYIMFFDFHLLNRMMQYFTFLNIILASLLCKHSFKNGILLIIITFVAFNLLSAKKPNLHGIQPYQTLFEQDQLEKI